MPLASGAESAFRPTATRGGSPWSASAATASSVTALTSIRANSSEVTRSTTAFWTAGSSASGATVAT